MYDIDGAFSSIRITDLRTCMLHWISYRSLDQIEIIETAGDHWVSKRSLVQLDIIGPVRKH